MLFAGGSRLRDDTGDDARSGDARGDVGDGARTDGDGERAAGERARGGGDGRAGLLARRWAADERYGGAASTVLAFEAELREEAQEERAVDEAADERAVSDSGSDRSVAVTERVWRRCCWP